MRVIGRVVREPRKKRSNNTYSKIHSNRRNQYRVSNTWRKQGYRWFTSESPPHIM